MPLLRNVLVAIVFALSLLASWDRCGALLSRVEPTEPYPDVGIIEQVSGNLSALSRADGPKAALLGDSMAQNPGKGPSIARLTELALHETAPRNRAHVRSFAYSGFGMFAHWAVAQRLAETGVDVAIIEVGAHSFRAVPGIMGRTAVAGIVPPARIPTLINLPLQATGLTWDRMLLYATLRGSGLYPGWRSVRARQAHAASALDTTAQAMDGWFGHDATAEVAADRRSYEHRLATAPTRPPRWRPETARADYAPLAAGIGVDHPSLAFLCAAVKHLSDAGIGVLVYFTPANVEYFTAVGALGRDAWGGSLDTIEQAVVGAGGTFLDLHALLGDEHFRDAIGHLTVTHGGPGRVAGEIAAQLASMLAARDATRG